MSAQLKNIYIWQANGELRNLELKKDSVNVITGGSGKGKSSILYIVDYCLLSSTTSGISRLNIDDKSSWYGIRIFTSKGLVTIARPAAHVGNFKEVYFSSSGEVPETPFFNFKIHTLKKFLDKEFGLDSDLKVPYGGKTIKAGTKVTYRNFLNYCYQDQGTIVSPEYLYNKSSDLRVVERIERTFRMALGIVDAKGAIITERLAKLNESLKSFERKQEITRSKRYAFHEDLVSLEREAVSLGLLDDVSDDPAFSLDRLKGVANSTIQNFSVAENKIEDLEGIEVSLSRKLKKVVGFNEGFKSYLSVINESQDSIRPVDYLLDKYKEILPGTYAYPLLKELQLQLSATKQRWKKRDDSFLFVDISEHQKDIESQLSVVRREINDARSLCDKLSSPREIYRYQGRLEAKIDLYSEESGPQDYSERMAKIIDDLAELEKCVDDIESKREYTMGRLNNKINDHLSRLALKGYSGCSAVYSEKERSINLIVEEGEKVERMIDIGSASNYLYLHLSFFMSLHEVSRDNRVPWMPRFLILDQPSTPYALENDDDIMSLDLALIEINSFVEKMKPKGGMQVILMEHIPEDHWKKLGLNNFRLVDREFLDGYGLIN